MAFSCGIVTVGFWNGSILEHVGVYMGHGFVDKNLGGRPSRS